MYKHFQVLSIMLPRIEVQQAVSAPWATVAAVGRTAVAVTAILVPSHNQSLGLDGSVTHP